MYLTDAVRVAKTKNLGVGATQLMEHCILGVGQGFFQILRGEMDTEEETKDLKQIKQKKWNGEMGVKVNTIDKTVNGVEKAHKEYSAFANVVIDELEYFAVQNEPVPTETWVGWMEELKDMVLDNHRRNADCEELQMKRSFCALAKYLGLLIRQNDIRKNFFFAC